LQCTAMRWPRPKSLSRLMVLGLVLTTVPLLVALGDAGLQIRAIADQAQRTVQEGADTARASSELEGEIAELLRTARYYGVLPAKNAQKNLDIYRQKDESLTATRKQLETQLTSPAAREALEQLGLQQGTIRLSVLSMTPGESDLGDLRERFDELAALATKVREQSNVQIGAEVSALELRTQAARRSIVWKSALLIPLTIIAIIAVTLLVGRPMRQLDRAISELGSGTLSRPINVAGPQ